MDAPAPAAELPADVLARIDELTPVAAKARRVVVSTGAGVSAESGVPTFRDAQTGLWAKYDPVMLASYEGFCDDPATVWKWYDQRRQNMRGCRPNPGHVAIAEWQQSWRADGRGFTLVTQNIDDLHNQAGSSGIIELHGNIWFVRPLDGRLADAYRLDICPFESHPVYDDSGRLLRPHVVWFGEMLDPAKIDAAFAAAQNCDLLIVAGTSAVVYPAAALPQVALRGGATVVEVNPNPTELTRYADYVLQGTSGFVLPALWERVREMAE